MNEQIATKIQASNEAYLLASGMADLKNCETKITVVVSTLTHGAKRYMTKSVLNPIKKALGDLMNAVPDKYKDEMRRELVNDNTALQMEQIYNSTFSLTQEQRNRVEEFIEQLQKE